MKITGIILYGWIHPKNLLGLQKGCVKFGYPFLITKNINDVYKNDIYNLVILSDTPGNVKIPGKFIIFGPHISVFPPESLIGNEEHPNSVLNLLADWNVTVWKEFGNMKIPLAILPFGVDTEQFSPPPGGPGKEMFIYYKQRDPAILQNVMRIAPKDYRINLITYGSYHETDYINILRRCAFGIWIGRHESQGFALEEALSCNVPLIVLNVKTMKEEYNRAAYIYSHINKNLYATAIPWWSEKCGEVIYSVDELVSSIQKLINNYDFYEPRKFIENNLSISIAFQKMIKHVENIL